MIDGKSLDMQSQHAIDRVMITYNDMESDVSVAVKVRLVSTYHSQDHETRHHKWNMIFNVLCSVITCSYDLDMSVLNNK